MEDKLLQHAVVTILNQIYEEDFLGFSYGFRPGRRSANPWMSASCRPALPLLPVAPALP
jgi:hypothetical protein